MIKLETDQILFREKEFAIKAGGEYEPTGLVEVYRIDDPDKKAHWAYQANYVATGEHV